MYIRKAEVTDLDEIMTIYEYARTFMREHGNVTQWGNEYPSRKLIKNTIETRKCYVCMEKECIEGVFYYACEKDSTYSVIEDGAWLNDKPYAVVHRIAIAEGTRGIGSFCLNWALEQAGNVRIDTHIDNKPMQELLKKLGFSYCGKICLDDGSSRIAFQRCENAVIL